MCFGNVGGQQINIHFKSASTGMQIPYVNLYANETKNVFTTDEKGEIRISDKRLSFLTSHVSYEDSSITLGEIHTDTTIIIYLSPLISILENVSVLTRDDLKVKRYREFGNASRKPGLITSLHPNLKLGFWFNPVFASNKKHLLRSIRLKLQNYKTLRKLDFLIEVKIFPVQDKLIDSIPCNKKQIILNSRELKNVTEIFVQERLGFGQDGLFFSLEIPAVLGNDEATIDFPTEYRSEECELFVMKNTSRNWEQSVLRKTCSKSDNGKAKSLIFSTTYFSGK